MSVYLHGVGHSHPATEITNKFLEELDIGTTDAWITERVGIHSRRTVLSLDYIKHTKNVDPRASVDARTCDQGELGERAARLALERAGLTTDQIGMVIGGSSAPDFVTPAQACVVASRLGIEAPAFDLASACTSFFIPLHLLAMMEGSRAPEFVLIVVTETLTTTVDYRDRSGAVLWGDAAAAAVVSTRVKGRAEVLSTSLGSSPAGYDKVTIPRQGFFRQEGQAVQKFAIKRMTAMVQALKAEHRIPGRLLSFIGHQANLRMLNSVVDACEIPQSRHFHNVCEFGNTAAAGSPSVLSNRWDAWNSGDDIAVAGVGAGLTWSSYLLRFSR